MNHILNVIKDFFDPKDRTVAPTAPIPYTLAKSFRAQVPYLKDQGSAGSCTGHAGTELLEMLFRTHSTVGAGVLLRFSPLFLYAQERMNEGTFAQDAGAQSRTMFQVLAKVGCCLETDDPYDPKHVFLAPTAEERLDAANYRIGAYHRILDVPTAKSVLQSGYTFTVGMPLFPQFESDEAAGTGLIRLPQGSSIGGHEMHVIGYNDSKAVFGELGAFEVQNSWGAGWGDEGFCWVPYKYFDQTEGEWDFWTAHFGKPWVPRKAA